MPSPPLSCTGSVASTWRTCCSICKASAFPRRLSDKHTARASVTDRRRVIHRLRTRSFTTSLNVGGLTLSEAAASVSLAFVWRHRKRITPAWSGVTTIGCRLLRKSPSNRNTSSRSVGPVSFCSQCGLRCIVVVNGRPWLTQVRYPASAAMRSAPYPGLKNMGSPTGQLGWETEPAAQQG
jgi:hypothetical protein